ncbi:putative penicillin-binding protein [Exophiala viscosa]|uniref:Penicillin-binding protein n=1 Tax=Exophiala viscosa TaxID=2486360 RepID=A0AAN6DMZ5_9EURO|nr:putative penicillin-binding protein [Exophiala viscosa]
MRYAEVALWASFASMCRADSCPKIDLAVLGPVYQPASNSSYQAFIDASAQAAAALEEAIATGNTTYGAFDNRATSFSASVFSLTSDVPLFEFHFEAPQLNGSYTQGQLSANTIYRTGSLGKLLTIYTWLVDIGDSIYLDPITKYVPELAAAGESFKNPLLSTNWNEVTVGALASQISGIGRDFGVHLGDLAIPSFQSPPISNDIPDGYPPLNNETIIECTSYGDTLPPCSRAQFLDGIINHPPVYQSYTTPTYSNLAYAILGLAYENITGRSIFDGQRDVFIDKLGMTSTTPTVPGTGADAVIPRNDSYAVFSYDIGIQGPAGGQYTSTKDLITWGRAILNNSLLSDIVTRRWMKPTSFTSQWESAVGAPWEIYRLAIPINTIINASRIVDTYTKSGDIGQYSTYFGLVLDYNIGITVLAAGDNPNRQVPPVRGTLVDIFYNAAEQAAKEQARVAFTGTFKSTDRNSSITLGVDGGPGVVVQQWISNGTDFLANEWLASYNDFRLYPTNLKTQADGLTYYKYHLNFLASNGEPVTGDPWSELNDYWLEVDELIYNDLATDAFVIGFDQDGIVQSVSSQALRTNMLRQS